MGARGQEARRRRDAAAGIADARTRGAGAIQGGAHRQPRRRGGEEEQPGPKGSAPPEPRSNTPTRCAICWGSRSTSADLLPSDGGEFGFDNIATALTTSPLLLERYLTAGLRIAELAVGDAAAEPGTATFTISTVVTQNQHVDGLPLGTRGGMMVPHIFPADGEYVFSGRLLKTVAEGLVGVEGHETPHHFIVTIDGKQVFSAPIGGKEDHSRATENKPVAREEFDKRMTSPRIKVTAGLHDVGFTFVERPTQEQNVWQPNLRASQEAHNPSGHAETAQRDHRRALQLRPASASRRHGSACSSARRNRRRRKRRARSRSCPRWRAARSGGR